VKGHDRAGATRAAPFTLAVLPWSLPVIASNWAPPGGSKEYPMITETQTRVIVLQLSDELLAQLQPFLAGLDITTTAHKVEPSTQRLTMRGEVYAALAERVGSALDYDVRWQPNEYEPDGFVASVGCPQCGAQILANRAEIACACGQAITLI
jgi:hypothetical protein